MQNDEAPSTIVRLRWLGCLALGIGLAFIKPLIIWVQVGLESGLHSCTLVVPLVCVALGWRNRDELPRQCRSAPAVGVLLIAAGLVALSAPNWTGAGHQPLSQLDSLALRILALVLFLYGAAFQTVGMQVMRALAFPAVFLLFMVPLPEFAVNALEVFFQHSSAEVAGWFFAWSGAPVYHDSLYFKLPGVEMKVAQECSGIRSSYALFLTSLIAGHVLLRWNTHRILLAAFVIPLAIMRNAFRVFTLGMLSYYYDRGVLDSALHHQGGPIFFALSLIPFFAVVWWMCRREARSSAGSAASTVKGPVEAMAEPQKK